jgi:hypothetical protein
MTTPKIVPPELLDLHDRQDRLEQRDEDHPGDHVA